MTLELLKYSTRLGEEGEGRGHGHTATKARPGQVIQ
jgi:hypothetical protein